MGQPLPLPIKEIALVGLPQAGKTEFLVKTKLNVTVDDTGKQKIFVVHHKSVLIKKFDLGEEKYHEFQQSIFQNCSGILFVFDSENKTEFPRAVEELKRILNIDEVKSKPIALLANKQDLPNAAPISELKTIFEPCFIHPNQPFLMQPTCFWSGEGIYESLEWMNNQFTTKKSL